MMKRLLKILTKIIPHVCISLCIMMGVLIFINTKNTAMGFLRGPIFEIALIVLCVVAFATALIAVRSAKKNSVKKDKND